MGALYSYTIDEGTNCVHVFMGDREIMIQPFNPVTGKPFTDEEAMEWGEEQIVPKNLANEPTT